MAIAKSGQVQLSLEFRWQPLGPVRGDVGGDLAFPKAARQAGVYRFRLSANGRTKCYVGQTDDLRRRFEHFRKPGPSQATNIRINKNMREHLTAGGMVEIDIAARQVTVTASNEAIHVELADKATRLLLENAALVVETAAGTEMLNL